MLTEEINITNKLHHLNKYSKLILLVLNILIMYIVITTIFPPLRVFVGNNSLIVFLLMGIFFVISFFIKSNFYLNPSKQRFATLIFVFYTFTIPYLFSNPTIGNRYLDYSTIFFFYIVYEFNNYVKCSKYNKGIIITAIPFFLFTLIKTGIALIENPSISRSIKSTGVHTFSLFSRGIGGYEFIYFLMFLTIILSYLIISKNINANIFVKCFICLIFIGSVFVVILSNYFMAFLVMVFSIILIFVLRFFVQKKYLYILMLILASILLVLIWRQLAIFLLDITVDIMDTGYNRIRLLTIKNNLISGTNTDISSDRFSIFMMSVESFIDKPIFGIITEPIRTSAGFLTGFGQHSHIMDTYALFGFGIGTLQLYIICQPFIKRIKMMKFNREFPIVVFTSMLILFNYNIVTPSFGFALFMIFPILSDSIAIEANNKTKRIKDQVEEGHNEHK